MELRTARLRLRPFEDADRAPFAALNADPRVMATLPGELDRTASDAFVDRIEQRRGERGYAVWALEVVDGGDLDGAFVGYTGLWDAPPTVPFAPAVEVGWRLAHHAWGRGYATEAAIASVDDGLLRVGLPEVLSFTATTNERSRAVMTRIGLVHDPAEDFEHPGLPAGHPLRPHVVHRFADLDGRRAEARARARARA